MHVAALASDRVTLDDDKDSELHCSIVGEATFWRPPRPVEKVRIERYGAFFGSTVYGDDGLLLFAPPNTERWDRRIVETSTFWIVNEPQRAPCGGTLRLVALDADGGGGVSTFLGAASLAGAAVAVLWWFGSRRRPPRPPRRSELGGADVPLP